MSLNWNGQAVEGWDDIPWETRQAAIFATMAVDLGEITEANHEEFYSRYVGFCFAINDTPDLTLDQIKALTGLKTNVFNTTPAAYRKKLARIAQSKVQDWIYAEKQGWHKPKPEEVQTSENQG